MSEANILNPNAASPLNPDFPYTEIVPPENFATFRSRSGGAFYQRQVDGQPRRFALTWASRPQADIDLLRQWAEQYRGDFFSLYDPERGRYYSGTFIGGIQEFPTQAHDQASATATFQEIAGLALNAYYGASAGDWTRDGVLKYPRDGYGQDRIKKTLGVWTYGANANAKNGSDFTNTNLNATDCAEFQYWGYGFRFWARKDANLGIAALSCTDLSGNVELAATNIDFYAAAPAAAAVLLTKYDLKLGFHRIKLLATNTKNAASSAKTVPWDTIEVME